MWMQNWKKKAQILKGVILSGGHQLAKPLHPSVTKILEMFRTAARTGDGSTLQADLAALPPPDKDSQPMWEPASIHGWEMQAMMYLENGQLWWLFRATRKNERTPSASDIAFLYKIVEFLGGDVSRDCIIGPTSPPEGEPPLPFGWWTWFNRDQLLEIQTKGWKKTAQMRIVPAGSPETDGFKRLPSQRDGGVA